MLSWMIRQTRNQKGFTLIELLVVVAIIALLTAFAVPRLFDAINKSKGTVGQSDVSTISDGLERYYFDENNYPKANADTGLKEGGPIKATSYLKPATSFVNGFKQGYMYFSDANGSFYVLVDPAREKTGYSLICGPRASDGTFTEANVWRAVIATNVYEFTASASFQHITTVGGTVLSTTKTAAPSKSQLAAGCWLAEYASSGFNAKETKLITN